MSYREIKVKLNSLANPAKAKILSRFFKTGPGEYGEGDIFLGVTIPKLRALAKEYKNISLDQLKVLLKSPIHEERMISVIILVLQYHKADSRHQQEIYRFYMEHLDWVNNWDLVDGSSPHIVGHFLEGKKKDILDQLARSVNLWHRRVAILATFYEIKKGRHQETFRIAKMLLNDQHDLIHKAVGWMLREVGKYCSESIEESFLNQHYQQIPRTMLRYAIEKFPEKKRKFYMQKGLKIKKETS